VGPTTFLSFPSLEGGQGGLIKQLYRSIEVGWAQYLNMGILNTLSNAHTNPSTLYKWRVTPPFIKGSRAMPFLLKAMPPFIKGIGPPL